MARRDFPHFSLQFLVSSLYRPTFRFCCFCIFLHVFFFAYFLFFMFPDFFTFFVFKFLYFFLSFLSYLLNCRPLYPVPFFVSDGRRHFAKWLWWLRLTHSRILNSLFYNLNACFSVHSCISIYITPTNTQALIYLTWTCLHVSVLYGHHQGSIQAHSNKHTTENRTGHFNLLNF
jgi:hypothetical protein